MQDMVYLVPVSCTAVLDSEWNGMYLEHSEAYCGLMYIIIYTHSKHGNQKTGYTEVSLCNNIICRLVVYVYTLPTMWIVNINPFFCTIYVANTWVGHDMQIFSD